MLNLNKIGRPLCKISGGKYNGMIVSVSTDHNEENKEGDELIKEFRRLAIPNDSKFQQMPDTTKGREILYITGCSGSGKKHIYKKIY